MAREFPPDSFNPFADLLGMKYDHCEDGRCLSHLVITDAMMNPHHVLHGGVIFSIADTSMGAALYPSLGEDELCATIEIKLNFIKPVAGGRLDCDTYVVRRGRNVAVLESELTCEGKLVAKALGSYSIFKLKPKPA